MRIIEVETHCQFCDEDLGYFRLSLVDCSLCQSCFNDRSKTRTIIEAELSGLDRSKLKKYHYKNYIIYSTEECEKLEQHEGLSNKDVLILKDSPLCYSMSESKRERIIENLIKVKKLDPGLINNKFVKIFISFGQIPTETDKVFFRGLVESFRLIG